MVHMKVKLNNNFKIIHFNFKNDHTLVTEDLTFLHNSLLIPF